MKTVLLVEDNQDDVFFMKLACQRSGIPHKLQIVTDGAAAVDYLSGTGRYADRSTHPLPELVFLDIQLPSRSGHDVLEKAREQLKLKNLPIVMLTSSRESRDVTRAYSLGVTSYLRKIAEPAEFGQAIRVILKFWLELNTTTKWEL